MIALQATLKGEAVDKDETGAVVTSPYVSIYDDILDASDVRIADDATLTEWGADAHYATTFDACKLEEPRYKMYYNEVFNLKDLVTMKKLIFTVNSRSRTTAYHIDLL